MRSVIYGVATLWLCSFCNQNSKRVDSDVEGVTQSILKYTEDWESEIDGRYRNKSILEEINDAKQRYTLQVGDSLSKLAKGAVIYCENELKLDQYRFSMRENISLLKKKNNKKLRISSIDVDRAKRKGRMSISYPIFTLDRKIAMVHVREYFGPLQASMELFVLEKNGNTWMVIERYMRSIS